MIPSAPGVYRRFRQLDPYEAEINQTICGLHWNLAILVRAKFRRSVRLRREVLQEFRIAQRRK